MTRTCTGSPRTRLPRRRCIVSRKRQPAASAVTIYLGTPDDTLEDIAVDDEYVYALDTHASALLRVPKGGGDRENLLTGLKQPTSLVVDAERDLRSRRCLRHER